MEYKIDTDAVRTVYIHSLQWLRCRSKLGGQLWKENWFLGWPRDHRKQYRNMLDCKASEATTAALMWTLIYSFNRSHSRLIVKSSEAPVQGTIDRCPSLLRCLAVEHTEPDLKNVFRLYGSSPSSRVGKSPMKHGYSSDSHIWGMTLIHFGSKWLIGAFAHLGGEHLHIMIWLKIVGIREM